MSNLMTINVIELEMSIQNNTKFLKVIPSCADSGLNIAKGSYKRIMCIKLLWEHFQ